MITTQLKTALRAYLDHIGPANDFDVLPVDSAWVARLARLELQLGTALDADPVMDLTNHHNAALCPYCTPKRQALEALLASFDAWLGNSEGLMIEDVVAWREQLAAALDVPPRP